MSAFTGSKVEKTLSQLVDMLALYLQQCINSKQEPFRSHYFLLGVALMMSLRDMASSADTAQLIIKGQGQVAKETSLSTVWAFLSHQPLMMTQRAQTQIVMVLCWSLDSMTSINTSRLDSYIASLSATVLS